MALILLLVKPKYLPGFRICDQNVYALIGGNIIYHFGDSIALHFLDQTPGLYADLYHTGTPVIPTYHRIAAARCILPVSDREDISTDLGLRHRSAIGVTVLSDAVVVVVSEQTGSISLCRGGDITHGISPVVLETMLKDIFVNKKEPVSTEKVEENAHE